MKKRILILAAVFSATIYSCGSDDEPNFSEQGTWKLIFRSEVGDDGIVLDCEKQTTYNFSGNTLQATVYDPNEDESDCAAPQSGVFSYRIDDNDFLIFLNNAGEVIETDLNIEVRIFDNEMELVYRDPDDSPTSAIKNEKFEKQ